MNFLWMLPLALLPVLFHLLLRVRKQVVLFPSLMFFLQADPKLGARKQIREWLVLLLRCLAIACLLLALSRPVWLASGGSGAVAQVVMIDNSASMAGAAPDGRSKLAVALDAVAAMVGAKQASDPMAVMLTVDDPAAAVPEGFVSQRETLRALLGRVKDTQASGSPASALAQASALLSRSSLPRREIHLFTDLQEVEWGAIAHTPLPLPASTRLVVHRIASQPQDAPNAAVAGIALPNKRLLAGRRYLAAVTLQNTSKEEARIRLDTTDQNGLKSSQPVAVPAQGTRVVSVPFETRQPGTGWLGVEIGHDAFRTDNQAFTTFTAQPKKKVLFLGAAQDFGNLPLALSPTGDGALTGLVPVFKGAGAGIAAELQAECALVVARWSGWPGDKGEAEALRVYVAQGGNLLLVPATSGPPRVPAWIPVSLQQSVTSAAGLPLVVTGRKDAVWDDLRSSAGEVVLHQWRAFQAQTLSSATNAVPLLSLENGAPVLSVAALGAGRVFLSGMRFDVTSTTLPVKAAFLALVQSMALAGGPAAAQSRTLVAGGRWPAQADPAAAASIHTVAGAVVEWQGRAGEMPSLPRSGVYELATGQDTCLLAVRAAEREGRTAFIGSATIPALAGLTYTVADYQDADALLRNLRRARTGFDLYLPFLLLALLAVLLEAWLIGWFAVLYRSLQARLTRRQALLLVPKGVVALLLVMALLDPLWTSTVTLSSANRLLAVVDVSSSMDVKDDGARSRLERASAALERLRQQLPAGLGLTALEFDTALREVPGRPGASVNLQKLRQTDLGGTLLALARRADLAAYAGVILLTDGGDEPADHAELPSVPLYVVGIGNDLAQAGDLAVAEVACPATVEKLATFEIAVDLSARRQGALAASDLSHTAVVLEREQDGQWIRESAQTVNLANGWARSVFPVTCPEPGRQRFRASVPLLPGEVSHANNSRVISVDVRKKTLHVLYFARELGAEMKVLRGELLRDAGVTFTALYRTTGERFTVQGGKFPGDDSLAAGFPTDPAILRYFDCIMVGSVAAADWQDGQMQALRTYVENGGAVVFLGDEAAAGSGEGARSFGPLLPWDTAERGGDMLHGAFAVSVPAAASSHPVVAGLPALLAQSAGATVASLHRVGAVRPGATVLLTVTVERQTCPLVALQRFGKGHVLAMASNTLWQWAKRSPDLQQAYGLLWRQAVRNLAASLDGGQLLAVKWSAEGYRPGEQAVVEIRPVLPAAEQALQLTASFQVDDTRQSVPVEPLQGQLGLYAVKYTFEKRGTYTFALAVRQGHNVLETYEKTLPVGALAGEGSRLELDEAALQRLAQRSGGAYYREQQSDRLAPDLAARHLTKNVTSEVSLVSGSPWFALLFVGVLACEWLIRRKRNLF